MSTTDLTVAEVSLVYFDKAREALSLAHSVDEVKKIRDQAEAIRAYIKQQKGSFEMQNQAAEIKLRAERRAGEMLKEQPKNEGGRPLENRLHDATSFGVFDIPSYADLGIEKTQAINSRDKIIRVTAVNYWYTTDDLGRMIYYLLANKIIPAAREKEAERLSRWIRDSFQRKLF